MKRADEAISCCWVQTSYLLYPAIRDGQRELVEMAKDDPAVCAKQREEWAKSQSQLAPDWEVWNQANREGAERRKLC